jgi:hypothetical protein
LDRDRGGLWVLALWGEGLPPATAAQGVWAAELYAEYWYYRIIRPDVAAEARRVHSVFDDPTSQQHCVSYWELQRDEAQLAKDEAEEAKEPPKPRSPDGTTMATRADIDRLLMAPECRRGRKGEG